MEAGKRPGELLEEILKDKKITPSEFGRAMDGDYRLIRRWIQGIGFDRNRRNQKRAEEYLKLPDGHFAKAQAAHNAEVQRQKVFANFEATWQGRPLDQYERATLWSWRFYGSIKPNVMFYQLQVGVIRDQVPMSVVQRVLELNERADNELAARTDFPDVSEVLQEVESPPNGDVELPKLPARKTRKPTKKSARPRGK